MRHHQMGDVPAGRHVHLRDTDGSRELDDPSCALSRHEPGDPQPTTAT